MREGVFFSHIQKKGGSQILQSFSCKLQTYQNFHFDSTMLAMLPTHLFSARRNDRRTSSVPIVLSLTMWLLCLAMTTIQPVGAQEDPPVFTSKGTYSVLVVRVTDVNGNEPDYTAEEIGTSIFGTDDIFCHDCSMVRTTHHTLRITYSV